MTRYISLYNYIGSEIISICSESSNSTTKTWYLFMDCDTIHLTHIKNSQFPTSVAAHQAEVRGPPGGGAPGLGTAAPSNVTGKSRNKDYKLCIANKIP